MSESKMDQDWMNYTIKQMKRSKLYENLPVEYKKSQYKKAQDLAELLNTAMRDKNIPQEFRVIEYEVSKKTINDNEKNNKSQKSSPVNTPGSIPSSPSSSSPNSPKRKNNNNKINLDPKLFQNVKKQGSNYSIPSFTKQSNFDIVYK